MTKKESNGGRYMKNAKTEMMKRKRTEQGIPVSQLRLQLVILTELLA